jgi:hypothetical protein
VIIMTSNIGSVCLLDGVDAKGEITEQASSAGPATALSGRAFITGSAPRL